MAMQKTLKENLVPGKVVVFVDNRESASGITEQLREKAIVKTMNLHAGDYVCSEKVAVERKTVRDFVASIKDQRVFQQMKNLGDSFEKPVLIIEGNPDLLYGNGLHENAIRGALSSIAIDYRIPIIWTSNSRETAEQVYWIANREQVIGKKGLSIRPMPKKAKDSEIQEYIVAGLPGISNVRAKNLLGHFKSPAAVFSADEDRLMKVPGLGKKTAKTIRKILDSGYAPE